MKDTVITNEYRYALIRMISEKTLKLTDKHIPINAFDYICSLDEQGLRDINDFVDMQLLIKALRAH
jgi:hypothetical protein